ncbi:HAMP domain-containing sensor histidine kinase [Primorskyibacter flagellatus]|uniref:sensor histidine kinase n=1 Tax=Primorskyibacter flagellatus TaxID=1387277 RepID=UPI003A94BF60
MSQRRKVSLKVRLAGGAMLLTVGTLFTAGAMFIGMTRVSDRLETALAAEARIARYSTLSTQISTFLVISTEAVQAGLDAGARGERLEPVVRNINTTFGQLRRDLEQAVAQVEALGLDAQSRYATQSLGLARMEALIGNTVSGLQAGPDNAETLRARINGFASGFDPLLNQAVNAEILFRNEILTGIERLRQSLGRLAIVIAVLSVLTALAFYFGLVRPQFGRLDRLRDAARQIGSENYAVALPETRQDEIGLLYSETNRMAQALSLREDNIRKDRAALNKIIEQRTTELRTANAALEKTDENRRRFFADISHELRTPLTVILMEAQIGQRQGSGADSAFATIEERAARLNRRIDDLLRVARSENGELALDPQPVDLAEILTDVAEEVAHECANAGMVLEMAPCPALPVVADANWMRQVVVGLVRNAVRHARDGEIVRLVPIDEPQSVGIAVVDHGPGVPPSDIAGLFERFRRGRSPEGQGFGIGLALARWVVEAQGGTIRMQSPLPSDDAGGHGTKVSVRLPRKDP